MFCKWLWCQFCGVAMLAPRLCIQRNLRVSHRRLIMILGNWWKLRKLLSVDVCVDRHSIMNNVEILQLCIYCFLIYRSINKLTCSHFIVEYKYVSWITLITSCLWALVLHKRCFICINLVINFEHRFLWIDGLIHQIGDANLVETPACM